MIACQFFLQVSFLEVRFILRWGLLMPACQAACLISVKWPVCGSCLLIWKLMMTARAVPHLKLMTPQRGAGGKGRALGKGEPGRLLHSRILPLSGFLLRWCSSYDHVNPMTTRRGAFKLNLKQCHNILKSTGFSNSCIILGKKDPKTGIILHHVATP